MTINGSDKKVYDQKTAALHASVVGEFARMLLSASSQIAEAKNKKFGTKMTTDDVYEALRNMADFNKDKAITMAEAFVFLTKSVQGRLVVTASSTEKEWKNFARQADTLTKKMGSDFAFYDFSKLSSGKEIKI